MSQFLFNAVNDEAITKMARVSYQAFRYARVLQEDTSNPPWVDLPHKMKRKWIDKVRNQLFHNFPQATEDNSEEWLHRTVICSMMTLWSGSPQMAPMPTPLPYDVPEAVDEPHDSPTEDTPERDVVVNDDDSSEEEVNGDSAGEAAESGGGESEETSEESSDKKPRRKK